MEKNNPKNNPKQIGKEQSNGQLKLSPEDQSKNRVQRLTGAVVTAIQETSKDMEGLTIYEMTAVLTTALMSYNRRGIQSQFPQPKIEKK
jgi:hypothetical protein